MSLSNLIFIGISEFGDASLRKILERGYDVSGVITRKDDPCHDTAKQHGIRGFYIGDEQRSFSGRSKERLLEFVDRRKPDLMAMCIFETKLPDEIVENYDVLNFHGSELPEYKGWAPINWQIIDGKKELGMTVSRVQKGYDRGPILTRSSLEIGPNTTSGEAYDMMQPRAAKMLTDIVGLYLGGHRCVEEEQTQERVNPEAPEPNNENTKIYWCDDAKDIHNLVRGWNPMVYAHTFLGGEEILIEETRRVKYSKQGEPGQIVRYDKNSFEVACGEENLKVLSVMNKDERRYNMPRFIEKLKRVNPILK